MGTRNVTTWVCRVCGHEQGARRRRCGGTLPNGQPCRRVKPAHPQGYGCCAVDWHIGATRCGDLAHAASPIPARVGNGADWSGCGAPFLTENAANLPHPEHVYTAP